MTFAIDVEEAGWAELAGLEDLARDVAERVMSDLGKRAADFDLSMVFTDDAAIRVLNADWRGQDKATNVLSFPAEPVPLPPGEAQPLGDVILAFGVVQREAADQGKTLRDHAVHLMIHGILHLFGYDHMDGAEAARMEAAEIRILKGLGISDPYE